MGCSLLALDCCLQRHSRYSAALKHQQHQQQRQNQACSRPKEAQHASGLAGLRAGQPPLPPHQKLSGQQSRDINVVLIPQHNTLCTSVRSVSCKSRPLYSGPSPPGGGGSCATRRSGALSGRALTLSSSLQFAREGSSSANCRRMSEPSTARPPMAPPPPWSPPESAQTTSSRPPRVLTRMWQALFTNPMHKLGSQLHST